ncbi:MAG: acyltransferase family protein [Gammaproteobacteria bacterium]|nr:acyltransferase family protein [Gammaproteobacteria bacterium]
MGIASKPRLDWVDYAKGICIFAVVSMYSNNLTTELMGGSGWLQYWADFAKPFRMPDFFLLSGLFLGRVIHKNWRGYFDKKVVHYLYFFLLWTFINLLILFGENKLYGGDVYEFIQQLWRKSTSWPWKMMWFIQMLPAYFLFARITVRVPVVIILIVASVLQAFPQIVEAVVHAVPPLQGDRVLVDEFWKRYIFFYVGYIGAPYFFKFAEYIKNKVLFGVVGLVVWIAVNGSLVNMGLAEKPFVGLFLGIVGATAIITLGAIASNFRIARWISYLGKNSIVVYLAFYWPTKLAIDALAGVDILTRDLGTFCAIVTFIGVFAAIAAFWVVRESQYTRWLFERPKWLSVGSYEPKSAIASGKL